MITRLATADDLPGLASVHHCSIRDTFSGLLDDYVAARSLAHCEAAWKRRFDTGAHATLVLVQNDVIVGFVSAAPSSDADTDGTVGEVERIYLHPSIWGKGHGDVLIRWCQDRLLEQGFKLVKLWVFEVNLRARRFYERHGYSHDGHTKEEFGGVLLRYSKTLKGLTAG